MTQPTPVKPPAASMFRGLMGCGVLFLAFFVVAVIGAVVIPSKEVPEKPGSAATTARAKQHASTIVATIQDFQAGIPLLEQQGLARQQEPDGIDYRWTSSDGASWIRFYDSGADGKLDRISAVLATEGDQNASLIAGALSFRIVQLASGEDVSVDEFKAWLGSLASGDVVKGEARTFNKTRMHLQATLAANGKAGLRLTIGDEHP